jgi:branched-chain amino acid transport system permease protein
MPANLAMDLDTIGNAFVVVVGGMGSIGGAFAAALLIAEIKALCIALGNVSLFGIEISLSRLTLVVEFLVMAAVLVVRPWGLFGKPPAPWCQRSAGNTIAPPAALRAWPDGR